MAEVAVPTTTEVIVTETIETSSVPVSSVVVETNGVTPTEKTNGNSTTPVSNGGSKKKKEKEPKPVVEPEPPKDPKEDPLGWLKQQSKAAIHKINFHVLDWLQKQVVEDETKHQPVGKNGNVKKSEFLSSLQDGTLLAQLANKLSPGSVETVHEGEAAKEKANQVSNVQSFINFAKEKAGLAEDQVFSVEDLREKGKAGYEAVIKTLLQVALQAQQKFNQAAIDIDRVADDAKNAVEQSPLSQAYNYLREKYNSWKKGSPSSDKQVAQQEEKVTEATLSNGNNASDKVVEETQEQVNKLEIMSAPTTTVVSVSEQQVSSMPAVAAN